MTDPAAPDLAIVELKPCPFCARHPHGPIEQGNGLWRIYCCGFFLESPAKHLVIAAWNTRADSPEAAQCIEILVEALTEAREYFDDRAAAECDPSGPGYTGNDEMRQLVAIDAALAKVRGR